MKSSLAFLLIALAICGDTSGVVPRRMVRGVQKAARLKLVEDVVIEPDAEIPLRKQPTYYSSRMAIIFNNASWNLNFQSAVDVCDKFGGLLRFGEMNPEQWAEIEALVKSTKAQFWMEFAGGYGAAVPIFDGGCEDVDRVEMQDYGISNTSRTAFAVCSDIADQINEKPGPPVPPDPKPPVPQPKRWSIYRIILLTIACTSCVVLLLMIAVTLPRSTFEATLWPDDPRSTHVRKNVSRERGISCFVYFWLFLMVGSIASSASYILDHVLAATLQNTFFLMAFGSIGFRFLYHIYVRRTALDYYVSQWKLWTPYTFWMAACAFAGVSIWPLGLTGPSATGAVTGYYYISEAAYRNMPYHMGFVAYGLYRICLPLFDLGTTLIASNWSHTFAAIPVEVRALKSSGTGIPVWYRRFHFWLTLWIIGASILLGFQIVGPNLYADFADAVWLCVWPMGWSLANTHIADRVTVPRANHLTFSGRRHQL